MHFHGNGALNENPENKSASALGTQCALNAHSFHIDRVRTRNVKVVASGLEWNVGGHSLRHMTSVVTSGLEWNVGGRSLRHMTSVHRHSLMMSVCGT